MIVEETKLGRLTPLLISVQGQWCPGPNRQWRRWANSAEPFVAITYLSTPAECIWSKSARGESPIEVRLMLGPYDEQGRDVQVYFSVGGGYRRSRSLVSSPSYRPDIVSNGEFRCGVIQKFTQIEGEPGIELLILFLARQDVRSARCGLWKLRRELAESITNDSIRRMMTYGRTGRFIDGSP
jgi:hypothetical protein